MKKGTKNRNIGIKVYIIAFSFVLLCLCAIEGVTVAIKAGFNVDNPVATYCCDVDWFLKIKTIIKVNGPSVNGVVKGNFAYGLFKKVHDPLEFYDLDGRQIAKASDEYHLITQDDHCIIDSEGNVMAVMEGQFQLFGEKYKIYDEEGIYIGYLKVGITSTYGGLYDVNDCLVATYKSHFCFKDFELVIDEDAPLSDEAIILLFASYYSDFDADSSGSHHSNNSRK